jgi:hypothetical protein
MNDNKVSTSLKQVWRMCSSQIIEENFMDKQIRERKQEWGEKKVLIVGYGIES